MLISTSSFSHNLLSVSYLEHTPVCICVWECVSSVFIIDIADKLLGSDWWRVMSLSAQEPANEDEGFVSVRQQRLSPGRWRQIESVSYCRANVRGPARMFPELDTHAHASLGCTTAYSNTHATVVAFFLFDAHPR